MHVCVWAHTHTHCKNFKQRVLKTSKVVISLTTFLMSGIRWSMWKVKAGGQKKITVTLARDQVFLRLILIPKSKLYWTKQFFKPYYSSLPLTGKITKLQAVLAWDLYCNSGFSFCSLESSWHKENLMSDVTWFPNMQEKKEMLYSCVSISFLKI